MYSFKQITGISIVYCLLINLIPGAPASLWAERKIHSVREGDTLFGISALYGISMDKLIAANQLDRELIRTGEELIIPSPYPDSYMVMQGDTLSEISLRFGISMNRLASLNRIDPENLRTGMKLELVRPPEEGEIHKVQPGETLSWISLKYDLSVARIKQINNLTSSILIAGQELVLTDSRPQTIIIEPGDSLWKISSRYNITMETLKTWNNLEEENLFSGQQLQLYATVLNEPGPAEEAEPAGELIPEVKLASLSYSAPIYYSRPTESRTQPDNLYAEEDLDSPIENYRKASALMEEFNNAIETLPPLSSRLSGYKIVLDPGHGGLDPGAIVENRDGLGNSVYVVEDEYCYDIALRVYKDLKRNGADVFLTIISPNHTIRQSPDASLTFVNEKNEVWNDEKINRMNQSESWPLGSTAGLNKRVELAEDFYRGTPKEKTLFLSIHADNQPSAGEGTIALYHPEAEGSQSAEMAGFMADYLGMGSYSHKQELRVLHENPAAAAVLVEIRNLAFPNNSWAIRNEKLRQVDADRIVKGLIHYVDYRESLR